MNSNTPPPPQPPQDHQPAPPPPYGTAQPYGQAGPVGNLKDTSAIAKGAQIALGVGIFLQTVATVMPADSAVSTLTNIVTFAVVAGAGITVIIWLYQIVENSQSLGRQPSFGPVWAIFGWLILPYFWIVPAIQLNQQWDLNSPNPSQPSGTNWKIWAWFASAPIYLVLMVIGGVSIFSGAVSEVDNIDPNNEAQVEALATDLADRAMGWVYAAGAVQFAAGVLFILIIRELTARQKLLIASTRR